MRLSPGGIRCDIYSAYLRRQGFSRLFTLEGGVQNYHRQRGGELWRGGMFVFDGRMALSPGTRFLFLKQDLGMFYKLGLLSHYVINYRAMPSNLGPRIDHTERGVMDVDSTEYRYVVPNLLKCRI